MDLIALKERITAEVAARAEILVAASHQIHEHPELNYEEHFAHDLLTGLLEGEGLTVGRGAFGLETAFVARAGSRGPTIAVLCEYDALPGIGHACGHNIIATAGLGAGLAAAAVADDAGGQVVILGTPAEEGGGGKIRMIRAGAFDGVDAALMVHPAGAELTRMQAIAVQELTATYTGVAAHAAAFPHEGRNALRCRRARLPQRGRAAAAHPLRTSASTGSSRPAATSRTSFLPSRARSGWCDPAASAPSPRSRTGWRPASAPGPRPAGCHVEITWKDVVYADMLDNEVMVGLYAANARQVGRDVLEPDASMAVVGSTDMGNVSYVVPSIHPMIQAAPTGVPIHTPEFAGHARSAPGDLAVLDGAVALACTIADLWLAEGALAAVRAEFDATIDRVGPEARRSAIGGGSET